MTMIGDKNEAGIIDRMIKQLPDSHTYEELEKIREGNFSIKDK